LGTVHGPLKSLEILSDTLLSIWLLINSNKPFIAASFNVSIIGTIHLENPFLERIIEIDISMPSTVGAYANYFTFTP
jgi:hypothetical protein